MDKYGINNYRMAGYLLFACGLINLRYQWGEPTVAMRSATIFIPGAVIIAATFLPAIHPILQRREVKAILTVVGVLLVAYAFKN